MKVVAIIQARMGSTRLPGKVLEPIGGLSMLGLVVGRTQRARTVDEVVVATSTAPQDDAVAAEAERLGVACHRGSEDDVLDRYRGAAEEHEADVVVRITSDCPLIDPDLIDAVVDAFRSDLPDYASNILERRLPRGLDVEAFSRAALEQAWAEASSPHHRAHVTPFLHTQPERFRLRSVAPVSADHAGLRWTVDEPKDLELVRALAERLANPLAAGWEDVLRLFEEDPGLAEINADVRQKRPGEL